MTGSKHIKIADDLHDTIKFYCWYNKIKIEHFIDTQLRQIPEIKEFKVKKKTLKS